MDVPVFQKLSIPGVTTVMLFLSYSSQFLFRSIEPGPLTQNESYLFNVLVACLLFCYFRTCSTDPGKIPRDWHEQIALEENDAQASQRQRWCRKCDTYKPPRAHHCKTCKRCIMKMDHHCVWTANCVSHITFPHFVRFLSFSVSAMIYLEYFLFQRCAVLWQKRHLPSYLGPSMLQFTHLFLLGVINSILLFALSLLLIRTLWSLALNTTTIEGWEIERHETLLRRSRVLGGSLPGPDGTRVRIERQEFPWDIGIWANLCQGMGSRNPLVWVWPLARSPRSETGLTFEHNGIEDPRKPWPPPDPDRLFRAPRRPLKDGEAFTQPLDVDAFRKRQAADLARWNESVAPRRPFHERLEEMQREQQNRNEDYEGTDADESDSSDEAIAKPAQVVDDAGEEAWRNSEGERLADFGVDELVEFYDEDGNDDDDVPLAELIRRRKAGLD